MAFTTINNGSLFMNPKIYTGNGGTQTITDINFEPDLIYTKGRDLGESPWFTDNVVGLTKYRYSNGTGANSTYTTAVTGTNSDGYVLGDKNGFNNNTKTFVSWNWKANGTGSANTDGSISSTVSANTTSGFSIVSYAGSNSNVTVGHGLGVTPKMIIFKNRDSVTSWTVYHESLGNAKRLVLNTTGAEEGTNQFSFGTSPTSSLFALGGGYGDVNTSGANFVAYCFADVQGYSKFGSYTGNGNADGTFVYTGFKPSLLMLKNSSATADWVILDDKRNPTNDDAMKKLFPNDYRVEESGTYLDMLSNGFKLRTSGTDNNGNGNTLIYMAFASAPLVGTNNIPANAR